ncbi:unnamed protein product, partial [marine sediment metagenome]
CIRHWQNVLDRSGYLLSPSTEVIIKATLKYLKEMQASIAQAKYNTKAVGAPHRTELRRREAAKRNYIRLMSSKQLIEDYLFLQAYSVVRGRH